MQTSMAKQEAEALVCRGMKIYILDLNVFAEQHGYPKCVPEDNFVVDASNGVVYLALGEHHPTEKIDPPDYYSVNHKFGTHAAPWYFAQVTCNAQQITCIAWPAEDPGCCIKTRSQLGGHFSAPTFV